MAELAILYDVSSIDLGALNNATLATGDSKIDAARENGFRVLKSEIMAQIKGNTAGEGPIIFGTAFTLALAEIEEAIEADPQSSVNDQNDGETKRPVFPLGHFTLVPTNGEKMNDGQPVVYKPRWSSPEGDQMFYWAYNMSGAQLTTGGIIRIFAKHYGVWLRD